jgi:VIT1/CCC1 family predicted Fe2+/Mn2+ transporter
MTTTTKPGRRPSDYRPKASVTAAQRKTAQEAERIRAEEELNQAATVDSQADTIPVDENTLRKEQLVAAGIGSKKIAAKLTLLTVLFIGLVVGSICMFINDLVMPAVLTLVIAVFALLGLSLWIKSLYTALVNEFGKDETIDILLSMAKNKNSSKNP